MVYCRRHSSLDLLGTLEKGFYGRKYNSGHEKIFVSTVLKFSVNNIHYFTIPIFRLETLCTSLENTNVTILSALINNYTNSPLTYRKINRILTSCTVFKSRFTINFLID